MKSKRLLLMLLMAMFAPWAMMAQETLTIYEDGTATSSNVPVHGLWADAYLKCEIVVPAEELEEMNGGTISQMDFYLTSPAAAAWTGTFQVFLMEVDDATISDYYGPGNATIVYEGTLDGTQNTMTVAFSDNYVYGGGNLLIGVYQIVKGNYKSATFAGASVSGASGQNYSSSSLDAISFTQRNFIPKTTFTYTPGGGTVCSKPTIAVSNITHNQATLTVGGGSGTYNVQYKLASATSWTNVASNTTNTTFTLNNLTPLTAYDVQAQSVCEGGATSDWRAASFSTTAVAQEVGNAWSDNFEGATCGWELVNGELTNTWVWGTTNNNGGTHALYISNDGGTTYEYTVTSASMVYATKLLHFTDGVYTFDYNWMANGEGNYDYLRVALVPASVTLTAGTTTPSGFTYSALPTGWIALDGGSKLNQVTEWQDKNVEVEITAGTYYMVMAWRNDTSLGTQPPAAVDNVSITKVTCPRPTGLTATDVTAHTATLSWTENGEANQWEVQFGTDPVFENYLVETVYDNPTLNIVGLDEGTTYYARVRSHCGPGEDSECSDAVSFYTPLACPAPTGVGFSNITGHAATLSWTGSADSYDVMFRTAACASGFYEQFGTSIPSGWAMYTGHLGGVLADTVNLAPATYGWTFGMGNGVFDNHARVNIYGNYQRWLVTPTVTVPASGNFTFDIALTKYSGTLLPVADTLQQDDKFVVLISTDDMATWTILREWNNSGSSYVYNNITCSAEGEPVSISLSSYVGQNVRIAFYGESTNPTGVANTGGDNNLHIDNVLIGTPIPAGEWQVFNTEVNTYTFTGLNPLTTYEVKVASACPDEVGHETAIYSFTTDVACPKPTALVASEIGPNSFKLAWTENGEATAWQIQVDENTPIDVTTNPYTVTGLEPETGYAVKVRSNGGSDGYSEWSTIITVTTNVACPTPSNLQVTNLTAYSATVTWTGFNDGYNVTFSYPGDPLFNIDFENQTIPSTWNNTATADTLIWTVVTDTIHNSYYMKSGNAGVSSSTSTISFQYSLEYDGFISFDAECRGEGTSSVWDKCIFSIDGVAQFTYGAAVTGWNHYTFEVAAGEHTFTWSYTKDSSVNPSGDYFAVDNVDISYYSGTTFYVENTEYTFNDLTPETTYFVKVRGICDGVGTEWSETVSFTTPEITTLTQTIALGAGANWCSFNVEVALDDLKAILVEAAPGATSANPIMISSQNQNVRYNGMRWLGSLNFDLSKMYRITVPVACEITVEGMPIDPASYPVEIAPGTNWIAYPLNTNMQVSAAFADFAVNGDVVKHQNGNASYRNNRWLGSFEMQPGKGYKYVSADTETKTYTFPIAK